MLLKCQTQSACSKNLPKMAQWSKPRLKITTIPTAFHTQGNRTPSLSLTTSSETILANYKWCPPWTNPTPSRENERGSNNTLLALLSTKMSSSPTPIANCSLSLPNQVTSPSHWLKTINELKYRQQLYFQTESHAFLRSTLESQEIRYNY